MTDQACDVLINRHPRLRLDGLGLRGVIRRDPRTLTWAHGDHVAFNTPPPKSNGIEATCLYRGYIATFALEPDGQLRLTGFHGPFGLDAVDVDALLVGDFWMAVNEQFMGPRTYIPFRAGVVVEDPAEWYTEESMSVRLGRQHEQLASLLEKLRALPPEELQARLSQVCLGDDANRGDEVAAPADGNRK